MPNIFLPRWYFSKLNLQEIITRKSRHQSKIPSIECEFQMYSKLTALHRKPSAKTHAQGWNLFFYYFYAVSSLFMYSTHPCAKALIFAWAAAMICLNKNILGEQIHGGVSFSYIHTGSCVASKYITVLLTHEFFVFFNTFCRAHLPSRVSLFLPSREDAKRFCPTKLSTSVRRSISGQPAREHGSDFCGTSQTSVRREHRVSVRRSHHQKRGGRPGDKGDREHTGRVA